MIASSEEANTAVLRASLSRTAWAAATPSANSPIRVPSASVSTSRSGSGSRASRANSSMTATHWPSARIGNASAPRRPTSRAPSTRVNLSDWSTFVNQAGRPLSQTAPGNPKPWPITSWRVASSNSGASKPSRIQVAVARRASFPRTSHRCPMSQPIGSPIASSRSGPADSSESASASTRATPYCTARRAVSRSRSERSRAMPTARPLTRPTAASRMSWSDEPKSSAADAQRDRDREGEQGDDRGVAGTRAERGDDRPDQQQLDEHGVLRRRPGRPRRPRRRRSARVGILRGRRALHPYGSASPTRLPDYFRESTSPI